MPPVPKVQLLTIEGLIEKREKLDLPMFASDATFKRAERKRKVRRKKG